MIIQAFTVDNFACFKERVTFQFEPPSEGRNVYLIGGKNGQGKTTLLVALRACLFGIEERPEQIWKKAHSVNRVSGRRDISFQLAFTDPNGRKCELARFYRAAPGRSEPKYEMSVSLRISEKPVQGEEAIREHIEQLFPKDVAGFFLFDGEEIKSLADQTEQEAAEKIKGSIELLLGLRLYRTLQEDLDGLNNDLTKEAAATRRSEVETLDAKYTALLEHEEHLNRQKRDLSDQKSKQELRIQESREEYDNLIEEMREREKLEKNEQSLKARLDNLDRQISEAAKETLPYALVGAQIQEIIEKAAQERAVRTETESRKWLASKVDTLLKEMDQTYRCLCGRPVTEERYLDIQAKLRSLLMDGTAEQNTELLFDLSEQQIGALRDKEQRVHKRPALQKLCAEAHSLVGELQSVQTRLRRHTDLDERAEEYKHLSKVQQEAGQKLGRLETELKQVSMQLKEVPGEKDALCQQLGNMKQELLKSEKARAQAQLTENTIQLLDKLFDSLRQQKIEELERHTTEILKRLWSKSATLEKISIDPDSYASSPLHIEGGEIEKSTLSAGEKELFALSLLGGLAQCADCKPPIVIDTPLSRLDSGHRMNIVRNYYPTAGQQVIILSTDTEITPDLYAALQPHIRQTLTLQHDPQARSTSVAPGFFDIASGMEQEERYAAE